MVEEQALVLRTEQDKAWLEIVRRSPCGLCGQTRGCGISVWGRLFGHRRGAFEADNPIGAAAGDGVVVGVEERELLAGSLKVYGIPLLALLAGTAAGAWLAPVAAARDLYSVPGGVAGLALGLLWLKGRGGGTRRRPVILRRSEAGTCAHQHL